MTVKFILIAVIIAAGGALGAAAGEQVNERLRARKQLAEGLKRAAMAIIYRSKALSEALKEGGDRESAVLADIGRYIENHPAANVRSQAQAMLVCEKMLDKKSVEEAAGFIERMAFAVVTEDIKAALKDYEHEINAHLEAEGEVCGKRVKMIRALSLMGGLMAAVIIA